MPSARPAQLAAEECIKMSTRNRIRPFELGNWEEEINNWRKQ